MTKKEQSQVLEAVGLLNVRLRFFIGASIKDALVLGKRSELLTEKEAEDLLGIVEDKILTDVRNADEVRTFLAGNSQPQPAKQTESDAEDITPSKYYDIFIKPALHIILEEYAERIGQIFVKFICTGERLAEDELTDDEKLLWNVFMMMVEVRLNPEFSHYSDAFSDKEE